MALILNGKSLATQLRAGVAQQVVELQSKRNITPGLAVILVGDDNASQIYVRNKTKACEEAGFNHWQHLLPADTSEADLLKLVDQLNKDNSVHGILVQLPLPPQINSHHVIQAISPLKDADCFHPENIGKLLLKQPAPLPCTPAGVMEILAKHNVKIKGEHAVIIGRSNIVGKPMGILMLQAGATVTTCHRHTLDTAYFARQADILISAVGRAGLVKADWVKEGAVVIDIGINRLPNGKLVGDVEFDEVESKVSAITPVPGGVGPMTIAMLLQNTLTLAQHSKY